jgi:hypothetical protein
MEKKYEEWDKLIENLGKVDDSTKTSEESSNVNLSNIQKRNLILIGVGLVFVIILLSMFSGGGSATLDSGDGYKLTGSVSLEGDGAYINATLSATKSGYYQVNVSIYSSEGNFLGSNKGYYMLSEGESARVSFSISNIMNGADPARYSVSVTRG